jgi:hypothetical protein
MLCSHGKLPVKEELCLIHTFNLATSLLPNSIQISKPVPKQEMRQKGSDSWTFSIGRRGKQHMWKIFNE